MKIGIVTVGDELTSGATVDTNGPFITVELYREGWTVCARMAVGDDETAIVDALAYLTDRSRIVIVTGGLGPTADDRTREAIARAVKKNLVIDESIRDRLKERFRSYGLKWTENNEKQAYFPRGATIVKNPAGTAQGFYLPHGSSGIIALPGVPREVREMMPLSVMPLLRSLAGDGKRETAVRTVKLFGRTEAQIDEIVRAVTLPSARVSIGSYPQFPEIHLRITVRDESGEISDGLLNDVTSMIRNRLGDYVYGYDDDTIEEIIAAALRAREMTIAVAESCTGGMIGDRLTDVPGSSAYFERGYVTYTNVSKVELLGVPEEVIAAAGAVSEETARAMAEGVRAAARTDIGCATTGIAGPSGGTKEKPVGTVYIAVADGVHTTCRKFSFGGGRRRIKELSTRWALEMIRSCVEGERHGS